MDFFERVKSILPRAATKFEKNADVFLNFTHTPSSRQPYYKHDKLNHRYIIYVKALTPSQNRTLQEAIKASFDAGEFYGLVEESKLDLLNKLYKYDNQNDNRVLTFFEPILSRRDWETLRAALFIRQEFIDRTGLVGQLKRDLTSRYGQRGKTISNLCTAGYFEHVMIPLYNSSPQEFHTYYDLAVDRGIAAFFVSSAMSFDEMTKEINRVIQSAKAYGLTSIHIHGIGSKNIYKIKKFLDKLKEKLGFTGKNIFIEEKVGIMIVEIILK